MLTRRRFNHGLVLAGFALPRAGRAGESPAPRASFPLFDTHLQLLSSDVVRYPRLPGALGTGAPQPEVERLIAWMDESRVAGGVVVQNQTAYGFNNYYLLDSTDRFRSRLAPVAHLDAADDATPDLLRQYVRERGLAGLALSGKQSEDLAWLGSPAARRSWTVAAEHALAIVLPSPGRAAALAGEYLRLARDYPDVRVVIDELAWPDTRSVPDAGFEATLRTLAAVSNVYLKFTHANLGAGAGAEILRRTLGIFGADRLMWGSGAGGAAAAYPMLVAEAVAATAGLGADEQRKLLRDSGMRVFVRGGVRRA